MKPTAEMIHGRGYSPRQHSCFSRWAVANSPGEASGTPPTLKLEARCKQGGQAFVKYTNDRTSRCDLCRKGALKPHLSRKEATSAE